MEARRQADSLGAAAQAWMRLPVGVTGHRGANVMPRSERACFDDPMQVCLWHVYVRIQLSAIRTGYSSTRVIVNPPMNRDQLLIHQ